MADAMDWIENYLKNNWTILGIVGVISMVFVATGYRGLLKVPPAITAVSGIIALAAAAYGYMLTHGNPFVGYTYYHDGYYYFG